MQSSVSLVSIHGDNVKAMKQAIRESLDLVGCSIGKDIKKVVIKPNMCYYWDYSTGQTTDPRFIGSLIELIHEKTSSDTRISVVESDASAMKCKHAFKMLGYEKVCNDYNAELVNLSDDDGERMSVTVGGHTFVFIVPNTIRSADLKINVPKIKYTGEEEIKLTCALKNIFGCNPYPRKFKYHPRLTETIVAINKIMNFDVCLVDGNIVSGAQPRRLGLVMASKDPVAIDSAAAQIAGLNPNKIKYLLLAQEERLGNISFNQRGESLRYFRDRYPKTLARVRAWRIIDKVSAFFGRSIIGSMIGLG